MWNADLYEVDGQTYSLSAQAWEVRDDSGGWLCRNPDDGLNRGSGKHPTAVQGTEMLTCVGNGAHDGLTAVLVADWTGHEDHRRAHHPRRCAAAPGRIPCRVAVTAKRELAGRDPAEWPTPSIHRVPWSSGRGTRFCAIRGCGGYQIAAI